MLLGVRSSEVQQGNAHQAVTASKFINCTSHYTSNLSTLSVALGCAVWHERLLEFVPPAAATLLLCIFRCLSRLYLLLHNETNTETEALFLLQITVAQNVYSSARIQICRVVVWNMEPCADLSYTYTQKHTGI